ncbi:hypothetical protein R5R35_000359 [Gryllus longicercus]|uniref:Right handed beta helix domain-containing protein n=1 Tax=Gryllus longicercus TaxID=2509291 RepID=A0AAN9ZES6_9ORTH
MLNPITVHKSLDERLAEYSCIFTESEKNITASEVKYVWSDVVELALKNGGWQALWKIPRATCENLQIDFPTVVFVNVQELNCNELSALINIVAVEDDIEVPENHDALLIHLHPTVQQNDASLSIQDIAECLDKLRFFYTHIWQPWDDEDDKSRDWVSNRLEPRMKLFREMQAGVLSSHTVSCIRSLLQEARNLHKHKKLLEMKNTEHSLQPMLKDDCVDDSQEKDIALELMELKLKWDQTCQEIEMIENPSLREKIIKRRQKGQAYHSTGSEQIFIVWNGGNCMELLDLMSKARSVVSESAEIKPCTLMTALNFVEEGDSILLCQGVHKMNDEMMLMRNVTIKGCPSSSEVILSAAESCATLVDWTGIRIKFEDLSLSAPVTQALVVVRSGVMNAKNCQFLCDPHNTSTTGVCIMPGGRAELIDCDFSDFDAALAVHAGATLTLIRCRLSSCAIGIQVYDGGEVYLKDCLIQNCLEYGIVVRTLQNNIQNTVGSLCLLDSSESVVVESCKMQGNAQGDVFISPMPSNSLLYDINMDSEESSPHPISSKSDLEFEEHSSCSAILT